MPSIRSPRGARSPRWLCAALGVLAPLGLATPAAAAEPGQTTARGLYLSLRGGAAFSQSLTVRCRATPATSTLKTGTGFAGGGSVGYAFGNGVRVEAEAVYRSNGAGSLVAPSATTSLTGDVGSFAVIGDVFYDVPALRVGRFTPYLGAGIGVARVSANNLAVGGLTQVNGASARFAYQGIVGVSGELTPAWSVELDYRYLATADPTFRTLGGAAFSTHYRSQSIMVGGTYHFSH